MDRSAYCSLHFNNLLEPKCLTDLPIHIVPKGRSASLTESDTTNEWILRHALQFERYRLKLSIFPSRSGELRRYASPSYRTKARPVSSHYKTVCQLNEVVMERRQVIRRDPDVQGGTPVFAGTRVPVQTLIDYLKDGRTLEDFLDGFPSVSQAQAEAFLQMATESIAEDDGYARASQ